MRGVNNLEAMIAEHLKSRCTHAEMPSVAARAGLEIPPVEDGISKRDRAVAALAGRSERELGEIADPSRRPNQHHPSPCRL